MMLVHGCVFSICRSICQHNATCINLEIYTCSNCHTFLSICFIVSANLQEGTSSAAHTSNSVQEPYNLSLFNSHSIQCTLS